MATRSSPSSACTTISPFRSAASASHTACGMPVRVTVSPSFSRLPIPGQVMRTVFTSTCTHLPLLALHFSSTLS